MTAERTERLDRAVLRTELEGGPVVLSERMGSVRSVAVGLWFRQGRAHERIDEPGISHLLEHMVFKGTRRRSARELVWEIERLGGVIDAYTTHEVTAFEARAPADALDAALDVLTDLAFAPLLDARDLETERQVVLEELSTIEETPEDLVFERQASLLFGGHPYGEPIVGTRGSVSRLDVAALARLHEEAYRASNAVIAAAGALDHDTLIELVRCQVPPDPEPLRRGRPDAPRAHAGEHREEHRGARQSHLVAGGLTVPYRDPLRYSVVLVGTALGGGMSSRLFQRVREERGLAYSVYTFHSFFAAAGHAGAYLATSPRTAAAAREVLLEELRAVAEEGLRGAELEETRAQMKGRLMLSLESPGARMNRLAGLALYDEPYVTLDEIAGRIDEIDDERARAAAELLHPDRLAVLELAPGSGGEVDPVERGRS